MLERAQNAAFSFNTFTKKMQTGEDGLQSHMTIIPNILIMTYMVLWLLLLALIPKLEWDNVNPVNHQNRKLYERYSSRVLRCVGNGRHIL